MERIKNIFRLIHLSLWGLFTLLVGLQLRGEGDAYWLSTTAAFIATASYVFYGHYYLLTQYTGRKKGRSYWGRLAAVVLTGPLPFVLLHHRAPDAFWLSFGYYSPHLATTVPVFIFLGWLARTTKTLVLNTIRKEQLEKQAAEAELNYLKSQINPHFLFNTLNNIHTLVYKQAPAAPEAVMHLASLMRYMLYESNAATVPLARELAYVQDYVNLQQLRYRNNPVADLHLTGDMEAYSVAPLLFIHLLENAYKHSPARLEPGDLKIGVEVAAGRLTFSVQNPVRQKAASGLEEPGGIGLPNVRKRLALLYPNQHTLVIQHTGNTFTVVLTISGLHVQAHEINAQLLHY